MNTRNPERGSAMLVTMIVISAILAGATVLVSLQLAANRSTDLTRTGISALYCAEAGLTASRSTIAANQTTWADWLGTGNEPSFLTSINHDVDGDNVADWEVTLEDNFDETSGADDPDADLDSRIFVVSRCIKYPDTPREVRELINYSQLSNCYNSQRGGCGGNGNMN
jgi:hypothetical protein